MIVPSREALFRLAAGGCLRAGFTDGLRLIAARSRRRPAFSIFTYHRVNDLGDEFQPAMPTHVFERQIRYVAAHYTVLAVEDVVDRMSSGRIPRDAVAITFDDGYRDNLTHAAPILARFRVPATVFLATGFIGSGEVPWYDRLAIALKRTTRRSVSSPSGEELPLTSVTARVAALGRLQTDFKTLPEAQFQTSLASVLEGLGVSAEPSRKDLMLSWDDVLALHGLGFRIGAHTVTHPILSRVSVERAREEILESRRAIEAAVGLAPKAFAYPNGGQADYTPAVVDLVRAAGFTCAVTTRFGVNTNATSPWELRRGQPWEDDLPRFALKLAWYGLTLR
jgi:peptidoglycan/xylan/chitin deacetylase (PgdA/CDA1 family)